ncbi:ketoacyl-ACP synthase III [Lysinibacillus sp. FSL R7-0073]|uniref:3-oxoacyl-ACP synthase III family protein n=1 Tax=Lysinibacillus sp. FSL R7-0073 TaxID=2921669 RepID=UPI0030F5CB4E
MATANFSNICISGIACAVPKNVVDNDTYSSTLGDLEVKKFIENTGVKKRYVSHSKQTTSDLCYEAASKLLKHKEHDSESIDALIFISQTPDYIQPATSHILQKRLGLAKSCMCLDVNLGCSGYVYGMFLASSLIQSGAVDRVLLLVGDILRKNPVTEIKDQMLFGDAGSATIVERGENTVQGILNANGEGYTSLITPGAGTRRVLKEEESYWEITKPEMEGSEVFEFTIKEIPKIFKQFFNTFDKHIDDFDYCILHQANLFMLKHIGKKIKVQPEKLPISIDRYGNTNGASIPMTIVDLCDLENISKNVKLISSGFGIGLSWGIISFEVEGKDVLPMIYTDNYYEEAYLGK